MQNDHVISLKNKPQTPSPEGVPPVVSKRKVRRGQRLFAVFFALITIAIVFVSCYALYMHFTVPLASTNKSGNPDDVIAKVSKLMLLPNETPTIAVVSDLGKLSGQAFFANARQGDIVLMFAHAQKAVLYDPTLNKIIEVAPITNTQQ